MENFTTAFSFVVFVMRIKRTSSFGRLLQFNGDIYCIWIRRIYVISFLSIRFMWDFTASRFSSQLRSSLRYARWSQRIKRQVESGFNYYRRDYASQFILKKLKSVLDKHGRKATILSATGIYNASKDHNCSTNFEWKKCSIEDQVLEVFLNTFF